METFKPHVYTEEDGRELVRLLNLMTATVELPLVHIRYSNEFDERDADGNWQRTKLQWRLFDGEHTSQKELDDYDEPHATLMDALSGPVATFGGVTRAGSGGRQAVDAAHRRGPRRATARRAAAKPLELLQRYAWNGQAVELGQMFRLHKQRGEERLDAVCRLMSHQLGWELRLDVNGEMERSEACRSQTAVLDTGDQWRAAMIEKGWS